MNSRALKNYELQFLEQVIQVPEEKKVVICCVTVVTEIFLFPLRKHALYKISKFFLNKMWKYNGSKSN